MFILTDLTLGKHRMRNHWILPLIKLLTFYAIRKVRHAKRTKQSYVQGSSSDRRSHDGSSHYGGSYGGREYGGERRSFGGEERRRSPGRDGYRKSSGMGPPAARESLRSGGMRPRGHAPRRSYRGRSMRSRTLYRGVARTRSSFTARRYTLSDSSLSYGRAFKPIKSRR